MPGAEAAVRSAGMTTHEYVEFLWSLIFTGLAAWASGEPGGQLPAGASQANVDFYKKHEAALKESTHRRAAMVGKTKIGATRKNSNRKLIASALRARSPRPLLSDASFHPRRTFGTLQENDSTRPPCRPRAQPARARDLQPPS